MARERMTEARLNSMTLEELEGPWGNAWVCVAADINHDIIKQGGLIPNRVWEYSELVRALYNEVYDSICNRRQDLRDMDEFGLVVRHDGRTRESLEQELRYLGNAYLILDVWLQADMDEYFATNVYKVRKLRLRWAADDMRLPF